MKYIPSIIGGLLGLLFTGLPLSVLLGFAPEPPPPPEGTPVAAFMAAFAPTGYLNFVMVMEVVGGVLVAWPRTRVIGIFVLVPIVVNIVAFHAFITDGVGVFDPMLVVIEAGLVALIWIERRVLLELIAPPARRIAGPSRQEN